MNDAIGVPWERPSPCVMTNEWKGRPTDPSWWKKLNNASDALAIATRGARRKLSLGECATLQTFPVGYRFAGSTADRYRQVGNAVPPILAASVGDAIRRAENGGAPHRDGRGGLRARAASVLGRAVAIVRGLPPRGVTPEDIDGYVERHGDQLRAQVTEALT